jgi:hypothetical protein
MDQPLTLTCPLTGRVGSYVPGRDARPGAPRLRVETGPDTDGACPFCTGDVPVAPDPVRAVRGEVTWISCPNRYPAVVGEGTATHVVYAERHGPPLTAHAPTQQDDWSALLDAQQQLARRTGAWSLVVVNVGPSAGASQTHPHGQVLDLPTVPAVVAERTRRLAEPAVSGAVLADELTVAARGGIRLVVPAVPYGPADLRLVPEREGAFVDADPDEVATLVVRWTATLHDDRAVTDASPDAKLVVHERGTSAGRWFADLLATDRHGPAAGITPFTELEVPPPTRAAALRARDD